MLTVTQVPAEAPPASATPKQNSPVVATTVRDQGLDVATLQSQVRELQIELTGLQAQWDGLYSQLNAMLKNNPAPRGSFMRSIDPDIAVPMSALLLVVLGLPVSIAWAKRIMRGKPQVATPLPPDFNSRLENIERAIDTVAIEVERISEGQRFVTKILAQRPMDAGAGESSAEPPFVAPAPKALGAGPMEPITVPQRERVRQPIITPR